MSEYLILSPACLVLAWINWYYLNPLYPIPIAYHSNPVRGEWPNLPEISDLATKPIWQLLRMRNLI
jgi:hypothetical protein